jgi:hypothetical protein
MKQTASSRNGFSYEKMTHSRLGSTRSVSGQREGVTRKKILSGSSLARHSLGSLNQYYQMLLQRTDCRPLTSAAGGHGQMSRSLSDPGRIVSHWLRESTSSNASTPPSMPLRLSLRSLRRLASSRKFSIKRLTRSMAATVAHSSGSGGRRRSTRHGMPLWLRADQGIDDSVHWSLVHCQRCRRLEFSCRQMRGT